MASPTACTQHLSHAYGRSQRRQAASMLHSIPRSGLWLQIQDGKRASSWGNSSRGSKHWLQSTQHRRAGLPLSQASLKYSPRCIQLPAPSTVGFQEATGVISSTGAVSGVHVIGASSTLSLTGCVSLGKSIYLSASTTSSVKGNKLKTVITIQRPEGLWSCVDSCYHTPKAQGNDKAGSRLWG